MGFDHYKVEVLHYINPHLIWVSVREEGNHKIFFEQIGIYGILPQNITFGEDLVVKPERCKHWTPAATLVMKKLLLEAAEVWFSPSYVDKKTSIFDDNTHKYGDLITILHSGEHVDLGIELAKSNFALEDECAFHEELRDNNLSTTLDYVTATEVIKVIREAYKTTNIPKQHWEHALECQTMVHQQAKELENAIQARKLEMNNRGNISTLLKNKLNDLKLCKDIDEDSAGRATSYRSRPSRGLSISLKKKLDFIKSHGAQVKKTDEDGNKPVSNSDLKSGNAFEDQQCGNELSPIKYQENFKEDTNNNLKIKKGKKPQHRPSPEMNKIAIGPAGLQAHKFAVKLKSSTELEQPIQEEKKPAPQTEEQNKPEKDRDVYASTDSEVNIKISNLEILKKIRSKSSMLKNNDANISISPKNEVLSAIKRKKKILDDQRAKLNDSLSSTSDRDGSKNDAESDAESVTVLENKLGLINHIVKKTSNSELQLDTYNEDVKKSNVNPYRNVDGTISIFVDKLVSPILMVHTKKDNRIQPVSNMRDIPFGNDIHSVLKNMLIQKPMRPQTVSWPTILRGHSFFLIGPRRSGNTMGYLPAVCRLVSDFRNTPNTGLACIIVCATSHSVNTVESDCKMFLHNAKIFACYAGISDMHITTSLLNGCDILICTPPMLVRLIQEDFCLDFRNLSTFVVDDCEHISNVYPKELKFCLLKVMDIVKNRVNKEWKVQYVLVSRIWCDFMSSLARKAPDTVVCISAFEECVLYSKVATSVEFVILENKLDNVISFLNTIDKSKKTVIACKSDDEVKVLEKALTKLKYVVFSCDSTMTVQDLYNLDKMLRDYEEPVSGPVLVCCDGNLTHLNVTDAHYLVHYSLPDLYSMFCKRFAVLIDNYPSIFKDEDSNIKIKILLDDNNVEQLPKILNFIKRCTRDVPPFLDEISKSVLSTKNLKKAENLVPICSKILSIGKCPDFWNCADRHAIFKDHDSPKPWLPKEGVITFQILHYHSAVYYSARIESCINKGSTVKYPKAYSLLSIQLGMYFSKEANQKLHNMPKLGDVCAVTLKQNLFVRCEVSKILKYENNIPSLLLVRLIDEERYEVARDTWLYYLPEELKNIETHVVKVILSSLTPQDKDVTFSKLAKNKLKRVTDENDEIYMRGQIAMVIGNIIFVNTLEACQDLSSLEEVVVKCDFRNELLDGHALPNPEHIHNIKKICDFTVSSNEAVQNVIEVPKPIKILPKGRWAHLESHNFSSVFLMYAENPCQFFVRPIKFDACLTALIKDIKKYVSENPEAVENISIGDVILAEFPDDHTYERARVDEIQNNKVKCFFVDQAEWRDVSVKNIVAMTEKFITQLPFQAIECRLVGVKPFGDNWPDFTTNFFVDYCYDSANKLKQLFTKYFTKEKAAITEGHRYGVVLIDTYTDEDIVINQILIDKNLAEENDELELLSNVGFERNSNNTSDSDFEEDSESSKMDSIVDKSILVDNKKTQSEMPNNTSNSLIKSFENSDDSFDFVTDNLGQIGCVPITEVLSIKKVPDRKSPEKIIDLPIEPVLINEAPDAEWTEEILATPIDKSVSPLTSNAVPKLVNVSPDQFSKPKLLWRQNNNTVTIQIKLIVDDYDISIKERYIKFTATANDTQYGFDFELYGVVDINKSLHSNKGQYIQVKLWKLMARNWLTLTRDSAVKKWIVYDIESIDVSSDEESGDIIDDRKNLIKDVYESESDDNLQDDIVFSYKRE